LISDDLAFKALPNGRATAPMRTLSGNSRG
jgi:hypothetical protein